MTNKRYYQIKDISNMLDIPAYILRFWEKELTFKTHRTKGGRRLYNDRDIEILKELKICFYSKGLSLKFVKNHIQLHGLESLASLYDDKNGHDTNNAPSTATLIEDSFAYKKQQYEEEIRVMLLEIKQLKKNTEDLLLSCDALENITSFKAGGK